ncbi:MAG: DUF2341 domain-containing protein [Chloroflexota bacterium]|nr:DUF2341 domain-containing protein [Chloroflexota bacterium]
MGIIGPGLDVAYALTVNPITPSTQWALGSGWSVSSELGFEQGVLNGTDAGANLDVNLNELWYDASWTRRIPITIDNTGAALTNYQIQVSVTYDSDMQADFDDIRFTSSDSATLYTHWRESYTASTSAVFWMKVPSIPAASPSTMYMYYGNAAATDISDGDLTFEFFDDFEDGDISDWTQYGSGTVSLASDGGDGVLLKTANNESSGGYSLFNNGAISEYEAIFEINRINENGNADTGYGIEDGSFNGYGPRMQRFDSKNRRFIIDQRIGGTANELGRKNFSGDPNTWYVVKFRRYGSTIEFELYDTSDVLVQSHSETDATYTSFDRFVIHGGYEFWTDDIRVRKYVSPEPTTSMGVEQTPWYSTAWSKRAPITITNTGAALTNYQVEVQITYDADMQTDFDDIRFTDAAGTAFLSHWRESYVDSTSAVFFVKVPSIAASGTTTIYMYYGNASAPSGSDGDATFEFYDDFEDVDISDWTQYGTGTVSLASDAGDNVLLKTGSNEPNGGYSLFNNGAISEYEATFEINRINESGNVDTAYGIEDGSFNGYGPRLERLDGGTRKFIIDQRIGGTANELGRRNFSGNANTWYIVKFRRYGNTIEFELYDTSDVLVQSHSVTDATYTSFDRFVIHGGYEFWTDDIRVRKYASADPTTSTGAEESILYVASGTIASKVQDTGVSGTQWTNLSWGETLPAGTNITFEVRSSDTAFLKGDASPAWQDVSTLPVTGRYQQWRATLTTSAMTDTPTLEDVRVLHGYT